MDGGLQVYEKVLDVVSQWNGGLQVYENLLDVPIKWDGGLFVYEKLTDIVSTWNGGLQVYENIIAQSNPGKLHIYDGTQWVRMPQYFWNGTTWQQIV